MEDDSVVIEAKHDTPTNLRTPVPKASMNKRTQEDRWYDQNNRELDPFLHQSEGAINGEVQKERAQALSIVPQRNAGSSGRFRHHTEFEEVQGQNQMNGARYNYQVLYSR